MFLFSYPRTLAAEMERLKRTPLSAIPGLQLTYGCPNRKARRAERFKREAEKARAATGPEASAVDSKVGADG